jgi:hypothetical protein
MGARRWFGLVDGIGSVYIRSKTLSSSTTGHDLGSESLAGISREM